MTDQTNEGAPLRPMTGPEYFRACLGRDEHKPHTYGKHYARHHTIIRKVYDEALTRFPEAADVIAGFVFWECVERNRSEFLREMADEA